MVEVYHVIVDAVEHPNLEVLSWLAQLIIVIAVIATALVARSQLKEMSVFRKQRLRILNATLLMELDNRWDSTEMQASRKIFREMKDHLEETVGAANPVAGDHKRIELAKQAWSNALKEKRKNSIDEYSQLMAICGFFETVGLMVKRQYIMTEDVVDLFKGPMVNIETCFGGHIEDLGNETGMPHGLYEHARSLSRLAADAG